MNAFLGIDFGSSYTKVAVVDGEGVLRLRDVIPTRSRNRSALEELLSKVQAAYPIQESCATGYGRRAYRGSPLQQTEVVCASVGVARDYEGTKTIVDIGGEDIKIIESGPRGEVLHFYMNDKCSAGTGAFISEIAEKAELEIDEMSRLAEKSTSCRELNSFCTVFAKSEILGWKFDGVPIGDIAKGIYLSVVSRIEKLHFSLQYRVILCGGVIMYHPYLKVLLEEKLGVGVEIATEPLYRVALGAALLARRGRG